MPAGEMLVGEGPLHVPLAHVDQLDHFAEDFTEFDEQVAADVQDQLVQLTQRAALLELILAHFKHMG